MAPSRITDKDSGNFTISAIHSSSSRTLLLRTTSGGSQDCSPRRREKSEQSAFLAASLPSKAEPPELAALNRELNRMFKLQLGPLTLASDIEPVLAMWHKLVDIRASHGRKCVAEAWGKLAQATAIVARKMSLDDILTTIHVQNQLVQPCPRGLRLPSAMFMALADRAGPGGQLAAASDEGLLQFCSAVGRLIVAVSGLNASPGTFQQCTKALDRVAAVLPLAQAAMTEVVRRCKAAARAEAQRAADRAPTVSSALLVADALAELAGLPLAEPDICMRRACLAASAVEEEARKQTKVAGSWWQKLSGGNNCLCFSQDAAALSALPGTPPARASTFTVEVQRLTGEAAECLARFLSPVAVPAMSSSQLGHFAKALCCATMDDQGQPSCEPLRQCLGHVLAETSQRAEAQDPALRRSCVKTVISATRSRLLHIQFRLAAPEQGVAAALAQLEAWKWQAKQSRRARAVVQAPQVETPQECEADEKEATSLELKDMAVEEGDEITSRA